MRSLKILLVIYLIFSSISPAYMQAIRGNIIKGDLQDTTVSSIAGIRVNELDISTNGNFLVSRYNAKVDSLPGLNDNLSYAYEWKNGLWVKLGQVMKGQNYGGWIDNQDISDDGQQVILADFRSVDNSLKAYNYNGTDWELEEIYEQPIFPRSYGEIAVSREGNEIILFEPQRLALLHFYKENGEWKENETLNEAFKNQFDEIISFSRHVQYLEDLGKVVIGTSTWMASESLTYIFSLSDGIWSLEEVIEIADQGEQYRNNFAHEISQSGDRIVYTQETITSELDDYFVDYKYVVKDQSGQWEIINDDISPVDQIYSARNEREVELSDDGNIMYVIHKGAFNYDENNILERWEYDGTELKKTYSERVDAIFGYPLYNPIIQQAQNGKLLAVQGLESVGDTVYMVNTAVLDFSTLSVTDFSPGENLVSVFPNPVNDMVTFKLDESFNTNLTIHIYNPLGQKIKTERLDNGIFTINIGLSDLSSGIYLYQFQKTGIKIATGSFIKQ